VEIPADAKPLDGSIAPEVLEAFVAATTIAFQELTQTSVSAREPFVLCRPLTLDVTATVLLRHEPPGQLVLSFPLPVLSDLVERYVAGAAAITPELLDDAAGEFANVIAGQAKTMLKDTPAHYWLSTPVVARSASTNLPFSLGSSAVAWVFDCDSGTFTLQLYLSTVAH
jgi:CheY-specific phosphatase CheX